MLTVVERVLALARGVLGDAPTAALARLSAVAEEDSLEPGDVLWQEGEPADALHLLLDGELALETPAGDALRCVRAGSIADAHAVIRGLPRKERALAARRCLLLRVDREHLWRLLAEEPGLARSILVAVVELPQAA